MLTAPLCGQAHKEDVDGFALVRAFGTAVELPAFLRFMRYMASDDDDEDDA